MTRPFWSGHIQISLVSFGVKLFPAVEAKSEIRFHQISRKTGERVRHQKVSTSDQEPVENDDVVKGYEYSKGAYIPLQAPHSAKEPPEKKKPVARAGVSAAKEKPGPRLIQSSAKAADKRRKSA